MARRGRVGPGSDVEHEIGISQAGIRIRPRSVAAERFRRGASCFASDKVETANLGLETLPDRIGRLAAGMAPSQPAPLPASTLEFLRKHAANARG